MAEDLRPLIETRGDQMFLHLGDAEIARVRRFGALRRYGAGTLVVEAGQPAEGLYVILAGAVRVAAHETHDKPIVTHGPGAFMGELAQLSGRPSLTDGIAEGDVEAILIPPPRLRDLMVEEAELGERIMRALILRRVALLQDGVGGPVIVGRADNGDVLRLEGFLERNGHPHHRLDPDADESTKALLERFHLSPADLPIVLCPNGEMLRNPSETQLARCIGMSAGVDASKIYDVAVVGAGPAGLAAAVYGASEGLSVLVLDCRAFGGQAGASARIENYLGFPTGISGLALTARAYNQAQKFGADMAIPEEVVSLGDCAEKDCRFELALTGGAKVKSRAIVVASGAQYRKLDVANLAEYEGSHVHYWASPLEGRLCSGQEVGLVGGGNSAGQAAVYLAGTAGKVWLLVRGKSLDATMSRYLCERIAAQPNIEVVLESEVIALDGKDGALEAIRWRHRETGVETHRAMRHLFLFIGAEPNTGWLAQSGIELDEKGFVRADGLAAGKHRPFETNRPGIFAIGDVRSGSVKRVAAAVGEGAQVVATIHAFLADPALAVAPAA
ncbi:MAG TPA: FAD-dependent oxidoreductase [Rhizomicrobium sp.]|jgi:thioredoxin reductase (NADPH)|nr:FAD-dependent oxidoreductase [Rhizomicrobium sp.]